MKENRRVTVNEIAAHLDMSHGSAHHIVRDRGEKNIKIFHLTHPRTIRLLGDKHTVMIRNTYQELIALCLSQKRIFPGIKYFIFGTTPSHVSP